MDNTIHTILWDVDHNWGDALGLEAGTLDELVVTLVDDPDQGLGHGDRIVARRRVRLGDATLTVAADGHTVSAAPPEGTTFVEDVDDLNLEPWRVIAGSGPADLAAIAAEIRKVTPADALPIEAMIVYWRQDPEPVAVHVVITHEPLPLWGETLADISPGFRRWVDRGDGSCVARGDSPDGELAAAGGMAERVDPETGEIVKVA